MSQAHSSIIINIGLAKSFQNIKLRTEYGIGSVDSSNNKIVSYEDEEIDYDLLVSIPVNMGAEVIANSGLGDDLNFIPTDQNTLKSNHPTKFLKQCPCRF